jgi:hypothetical protein
VPTSSSVNSAAPVRSADAVAPGSTDSVGRGCSAAGSAPSRRRSACSASSGATVAARSSIARGETTESTPSPSGIVCRAARPISAAIPPRAHRDGPGVRRLAARSSQTAPSSPAVSSSPNRPRGPTAPKGSGAATTTTIRPSSKTRANGSPRPDSDALNPDPSSVTRTRAGAVVQADRPSGGPRDHALAPRARPSGVSFVAGSP